MIGAVIAVGMVLFAAGVGLGAFVLMSLANRSKSKD
ncbi:hypothetical protein CLV72_101472 [Allonocardiopsis opalescens]|uniref:Uncharacterized protein n=1 Tax=Allonocardiopsis opalescens TaxID=1144618 RepID=A0A2T0QD49_9ACTN|nr:hypothetical protein CLV72_101472 [Allonocardiopsis opalescens]